MKNKRKYPRKFCSQSSFFATRYGIHECYIKNLGDKGAFIKTDLFLPEGNVVTVAVPASAQDSSIKRKGKVIWTDKYGFGVEFRDAIPLPNSPWFQSQRLLTIISSKSSPITIM
ncbi:MAG: PilZ domain-containing protein [Desulfobacterales bacterium]|nr:PilZ domain-containing protein [Desulfobacterales bacterium]